MDTQETRRANLRALAEQWGGVGKLAKKLGYANASFVVQMCGPSPMRDVTERTARRVEVTLELPKLWLDSTHAPGPATGPAVDADVIALLHSAAAIVEEMGVVIGPTKFAEVVALAYERFVSTGRVDTNYIKSILNLLK